MSPREGVPLEVSAPFYNSHAQSDQLHVIFDVVGRPTVDLFNFLGVNATMRAALEKLGGEPADLRAVTHCHDEDALDLLQKLLDVDPRM